MRNVRFRIQPVLLVDGAFSRVHAVRRALVKSCFRSVLRMVGSRIFKYIMILNSIPSKRLLEVRNLFVTLSNRASIA